MVLITKFRDVVSIGYDDVFLRGQSIPELDGLQIQFNLYIGDEIRAERVDVEHKKP